MVKYTVQLAIVVALIALFVPRNVEAQRYANCDLCGYCYYPNQQARPAPSSWDNCVRCLYPELGAVKPEDKETLKLTSNMAPTPRPGAYFTQIGCISTDLGFTSAGAAPGVTQQILNILWSVAGAIAMITLLYGGIVIFTSRGDPQRLQDGKNIVRNAIVGLILVLFSVFLVRIIGGVILKIPGLE